MKLYPFAPLAELMKLSPSAAAIALNVGGSRFRYLTYGMTEQQADRMAVRAGFHPFVVWPEMVDDVIEDVGRSCVICEQMFVPVKQAELVCSLPCRLEYRRRWRRSYYAANGEQERERERRRYHERKVAS